MKKFLFMAAAALVMLTSCGGGGVKPETTKVNGPLGNVFEVVEKNYKIKDGNVSIEFKRIAAGIVSPDLVSDPSSCPSFKIELLDSDGNCIASDDTDAVWDEEALEALFSLGVGESASIEFKGLENAKGAKTFKVSSVWKDVSSEMIEEAMSRMAGESDYSSGSSDESSSSSFDYDESDDDNSDEVASSSSSRGSSEDWDKVLDELERYLNKTIALNKKAKNGDMSALAECADLMSSMQSLNDKLDRAKSDMTPAQVARYTKIYSKYAAEISKM